MFSNPQVIEEMDDVTIAAIVDLCTTKNVPTEGLVPALKTFYKSKNHLGSYLTRIDWTPDRGLREVFERLLITPDFGKGTFFEIVSNYAEGEVTIKRVSTRAEPKILYRRERKTEPTM